MALVFDTPRWKFIVTALDGSVPVGAGEVYWPSQRTYTDPLGGVRQASFSIPVSHPRSHWIVDNHALLKVYRRNRNGHWDHLFTGDIVQTEEQGTGNISQIIVTAADPFWRLLRRLVGMEQDASTGQAVGWKLGTLPDHKQDLTTMMWELWYYTDQQFPTGIKLGPYAMSGTTSIVGPVYSSFAGGVIQQIGTMLGAPDFWIEPMEPSGSMPGTIIGSLNVQPVRASDPQNPFKKNAIFEFGYGRYNVQNYDRLLNKQGMCNYAAALPPGWPTAIAAGDKVAIDQDTASQNQHGRFDDIVSTDVASLDLRNLLTKEAVQIRRDFQQQITFQPTVDSNLEYPTDYQTGDVVIARAYDNDSKSFRYNGSIRVYGVSVQIDDQDSETVQLTLIPDQQSSSFSSSGGL